ncbi:hypothetical protein N9L68_07880 [bacterium]|nr:hypothetical protein [bacterium]
MVLAESGWSGSEVWRGREPRADWLGERVLLRACSSRRGAHVRTAEHFPQPQGLRDGGGGPVATGNSAEKQLAHAQDRDHANAAMTAKAVKNAGFILGSLLRRGAPRVEETIDAHRHLEALTSRGHICVMEQMDKSSARPSLPRHGWTRHGGQ